ncbi:ADP-ribosylglycohydrolase [Kribbella aluminosa]|uniref:ADP-ribosylglycohydrolase n=1 Tax=Kribbella aluminosa TaxID=416017 RepID=A0ABS4UCI6_9ACTN|nr:ADP-ribosylglycohydrolase family protein [Kribbella aluminosa]MBP2349299.1 ADP-ribosylglycohydrolase [Kribbella aluminosa]
MTAYEERVYAGILGKLIGVYLGRPVEGWPYADIQARFGLVDRFVNGDLGLPLIVADDDISGTLAFARVVEDNGFFGPADAGETWLNYIVEDRTILWWGGYGRSTEHTAYLNLKRGVPAPDSGSIARNGSTLAEQIGAQIFSDAFALMTPGDPERAVALTRAAASVSHDGVALDAAAFFAAMRASAFEQQELAVLIERSLPFVTDRRLAELIVDVTSHVSKGDDWRSTRDWVDQHYGYARYPGPCHSLSNTAMALAALVVGDNDFRRVVAIASSVGFDTDSNAGTVGCITGVRLGLAAFDDAEELRSAVADRALVVSADGGECVTDAVLETRRIIRSAHKLEAAPVPVRRPRFDFDFPGAVQGFEPCPYLDGGAVRHHRFEDGSTALLIDGGSASTPVFLDPLDAVSNFSTLASPTLYPGNTVRAVVSAPDGASVRLYAIYDGTTTAEGPCIDVGERTELDWTVPSGGNPFRIGLSVSGTAYLHSLDWDGAPAEYSQSGILLSSIWDTQPRGLAPWVSSAKNFEADFATTFSVSHPDPLGVVTTGTRDWVDYEISSRLTFSLSRSAGIVVRARGHRNFTAAVFDGRLLSIVEQHGAERTVLATAPFALRRDAPYDVSVECAAAVVTVRVDGISMLSATTRRLAGGGAGFLVDIGTMSADGFTVRSHPRAQTLAEPRDQKGTTRYGTHRKMEQYLGQHQTG